MREASTVLKNLLNTEHFCMADLYTFTLTNGIILRYTSADLNIILAGHTFLGASSLIINRNKTKIAVGLAVDELTLSIFAGSQDKLVIATEIPFLHALQFGYFDNASVKLERIFLPSWASLASSDYVLFLFLGQVTVDEMNRTEAKLTVKSITALFDTPLPHNLYNPGCRHTVYKQGCALNRADFLTLGHVINGANSKNVIHHNLTQADAYFDLGVIQFTSGQNSTVKRTIKSYLSGTLLEIIPPLPYIPAVNDMFEIVPGCGGTRENCLNKFNNIGSFGGFPYIPIPETTL